MRAALVKLVALAAVSTVVGCYQSTESVVVLDVAPTTAAITMEQSQQFTAIAERDDGERIDVTTRVTWISADEDVATIDADGLATPEGPGETTIRALFGEHQASAELTVEGEVVLSGCTLEPSALTLTVGDTEQLTVAGQYSDGEVEEVTEWAVFDSSDSAVATVAAGGEVTAEGVGDAEITATVTRGDGARHECGRPTAVTVVAAPCTELTITAEIDTMPHGLTLQLAATCVFGEDAVDVTDQVEWSSSDDAIVTVDGDGLALGVDLGEVEIDAVFTNTNSTTVESTF